MAAGPAARFIPLGRLPAPLLALLALLGAATLWGTSFVAAKAVLTEIPPVPLACLRFAIAALVLVPLSYRIGTRPALGREAALLGVSGITLFFLCQYAGLRLAAAADATLILGGGLPVLTALLGATVLKERLDHWQAGGLGCSLLGVAAVAMFQPAAIAGSSPLGIGLLLLAAAFGAVYSILGRRAFSGLSVLPMLAGSTLYGVLFLAPAAAVELSAVDVALPSGRALLLLLYLGLGCSALAFALWAYGLRHLTATQNAVICNLELPIGLLAATALLGETLTWRHLGGSALVIAGALLAAGSRHTSSRSLRVLVARLADIARWRFRGSSGGSALTPASPSGEPLIARDGDAGTGRRPQLLENAASRPGRS